MTRTACLKSVYELAKQDERVVFIGSDLSPNTMLDFKRDFPDRFFMEGVQEQNIIGMAAGLAKEGFIPYVNTIATFLTRRCYEQILVDICLHNLPVRLLGNGAGLVYAPLGATHCAIEDIAIMRALPNMSVIDSGDNAEMKDAMQRTFEHPGPIYFRLGKDSCAPLYLDGIFWMGFERTVKAPMPLERKPDILLISTGCMTAYAKKALANLDGITFTHVHVPCIKPLPDGIGYSFHPWKLIVTVEDGIRNGGLGTAVLECLADGCKYTPVLRLGLPDAFPPHYGEQEDLFETYGLTPEKIAERIKEAYERIK